MTIEERLEQAEREIRRLREENARQRDMLAEMTEQLRIDFWRQRLLSCLDVAIYTYDLKQDELFLTAGFTKLIGESTETRLSWGDMQRYIHPDDMAGLGTSLAELAGKDFLVKEYRIVRDDGDVRWVSNRMLPQRGDDGEIAYIHGVVANVEERKRMSDKLSESRQRYECLFQRHPAIVAEFALDGRIVAVNDTILEMLGFTQEQVSGLHFNDFMAPGEIDDVAERFRRVLTGEPQQYESAVIHSDGVRVELSVTSIPIIVNDEVVGAYSICHDISEQKRIAAALKHSEEKYRSLVESSPLPIGMQRDGKLAYVNRAGLDLFGIQDASEVLGADIMEFLPPDSRSAIEESRERLQRGERSVPYTARACVRGGRQVDLEIVTHYNSADESFQFTFHDVTTRKRAEEALRESEDRYRRLVELSPDAILVHQDGNIVYMNSAALSLFGAREESDIIGTPLIERVLPVNRELVDLRASRIRSGEDVELLESVIVRLDGTHLDTESKGCVISYNGRPAILGCLRDITARKETERLRSEAQERLRESEERYFRLQESLDRFSREVYGVMDVRELERRLINEAKTELRVEKVSVVECSTDESFRLRAGSMPSEEMLAFVRQCDQPTLPTNTVMRCRVGWFIKIATRSGGSLFLCINERAERLELHPKRVWLRTLTRYVNVLYDNFLVIEDLSLELERFAGRSESPPWLLRMMFNVSENERKRLAQDLHDAALQEQIINYRSLEGLIADVGSSPELGARLSQLREGLLDVIYQIRLTCNELRPPLLKELGLVASLTSLIQTVQLRNDYVIEFEASYPRECDDETSLTIYRVVQELLSNATKHSNANVVKLGLTSNGGAVELRYEDDGIGMDMSRLESHVHSMGVYGIRERVRSLLGEVAFDSAPGRGVRIAVSLPTADALE